MQIKGAPWPSRENEPSGVVLNRTTVLTVSQRVASRADRSPADEGRELSSGLAVAGGSVVLPGLRAEERLLLGLVDGRLSIARLARLSGLSEEATLRHLRTLCGRRVLVPVEPKEVTIRGSSADRGFRLGPYEVAHKIGEGGMGSVYVGRRTGAVGFRRIFAIKVVRQDTGQEQAAERSFVREVQIGSLLDHPNIQSVYDVGTYKNQPYLVLQFVEGINLEEASYGRPVPPEILVTILLDVLRGLNGAHDLMDEDRRWLGLVHADVSPPNVLVGVDGVARLTDFGSARFTALGESGRADPTNLGKPAFMSPEQLMSEPLDRRSDLFAVGIMMWTALTGQELFSADSYDQILGNVLQKEVLPPSTHGSPRCLDEICLRALDRSRDGRFTSADEMAATLIKVAAANDLIAPPTAVGAFVRRHMANVDVERRKRIEAMLPLAPVVTGPTMEPLPPSPPTPGADPVIAPAQFARTMIIPPRDQGRSLSVPPSVSRIVGELGNLFRENGIWISLFAALAVLLVAVTVMAARHRRPVSPTTTAATRTATTQEQTQEQTKEPTRVSPASTEDGIVR